MTRKIDAAHSNISYLNNVDLGKVNCAGSPFSGSWTCLCILVNFSYIKEKSLAIVLVLDLIIKTFPARLDLVFDLIESYAIQILL